jgi:hypothetical protein
VVTLVIHNFLKDGKQNFITNRRQCLGNPLNGGDFRVINPKIFINLESV